LTEASRCPVCHARFRGAAICSRCGADLSRLMVLMTQAWRLRQASRRAIVAGEFERVLELAVKAQEIHGTPQGKALRAVGKWLARTPQ
jgi:predicted amidophosphoribosyltransferase